MKMIVPSSSIKVLDILQSAYKVLSGNISFGSVLSFDNTGNGLTYSSDNADGLYVRVGPIANPMALANHWGANNAATVITHNLNRRPIGFLVVNKNKTCDIYNGNPFVADDTTITLYITDNTADALLYIF